MPITWPFCIFLQHIGHQIKAEIPAHTRRGYEFVFSVAVLDLDLVFTGEAKLL